MALNNKQRKTLELIFTEPVPANINWQDIESLFTALGAMISEGKGSKISVTLNGRVFIYHRPHPQKETDKRAVKKVREVLQEAGIEP